jgi:hypothetical protein
MTSRDGLSAVSVLAIVLLTLIVSLNCTRPPDEDTSKSDPQKLPFDRPARSTGTSPSQSLIPSTNKLLEGTPIPIRLQKPLSSASAHPGDTFSATVDEPVVIDGQTLVERGTRATGRVLEVRPAVRSSAGSLEPGYLRIVLDSLKVGGKVVNLETSSIFAKGGAREERNPAAGATSDVSQWDKDRDPDIVFGTDRRLNFRLAQTVDLQAVESR